MWKLSQRSRNNHIFLFTGYVFFPLLRNATHYLTRLVLMMRFVSWVLKLSYFFFPRGGNIPHTMYAVCSVDLFLQCKSMRIFMYLFIQRCFSCHQTLSALNFGIKFSPASSEKQHDEWCWSNIFKLYTIEVLMDPSNNRILMWIKTTRATLTPRNECSVFWKTRCTDTDSKHAYLAQGGRNEFPETCLSCTLMKARCSFCLSPPAAPLLEAASELGTRLAIGELIRKRWQWGFATVNFHQPVFHISFYSTDPARRGLSLNDYKTPQGRDLRGGSWPCVKPARATNNDTVRLWFLWVSPSGPKPGKFMHIYAFHKPRII